jgi:hypothetical protein
MGKSPVPDLLSPGLGRCYRPGALKISRPFPPSFSRTLGEALVVVAIAIGLFSPSDRHEEQKVTAVARVTETGSDTADFNGDFWPDLAIGAPDEDLGSLKNAGVVHVLYNEGAPTYVLGSANRQMWSQDTVGILDRAEAGDRFGAALAWGDFDLDGYDDLAIGVPGEDLTTNSGTIKDAGAVAVLYGSSKGLTARDQFWNQNTRNIRDVAEGGDQFGAVLGAGHFGMLPGAQVNGEALVIGIPRENVGAKTDAGAVSVIYGVNNSGLGAYGNQFWTQDSSVIPGVAEPGDRFGQALAAGEYNSTNGGPDVLAIGTPFEDLGSGNSIRDAGAVTLLYSAGSGLGSGAVNWTQDSPEITDKPEAGDRFGTALATLDVDSAYSDDLAIGVPGEDLPGAVDAGVVQVLFGHSGGPSGPDEFLIQQGGETPEGGDAFGSSLGGMNEALAIGAPGEDLVTEAGPSADAGAVSVHYSPKRYFEPTEVETWTQDSIGIEDAADPGDKFGRQVRIAGRILGIGVALEDLGTKVDAGGVQVLYYVSQDGRFSAVNNRFWTQGSSGLGGAIEAGDRVGAGLLP